MTLPINIVFLIRPAILKSKKMQQKAKRRIIGTFSEIRNLIQSFTQITFGHIKDYQDPQWLWLLEIRKFLRYMLMPVLTEDQVKAMSETLEKTMNIRLKLTRVKNDSSAEDSKSSEKLEKAKPKHDPRVKWKEHYLGHFEDDIRQLGPLPLLNTDLFESKE